MQVKIASINNFEIIYNANNYITPGFAYLDEKSIQDSNKYVIKHHKQSIERSAAHKITSALVRLHHNLMDMENAHQVLTYFCPSCRFAWFWISLCCLTRTVR